MELAEILDPNAAAAQAGPSAPQNLSTGYNAMQQPVDPIVGQMMQPAKSPQELETRKNGWIEVIQKAMSDPNVMRAVGIFGATLGQPRAMGQSNVGKFGEAFMAGRTAYDFGVEAETQRSREATKERRAEEAHGVNIEATRAGTEQTRTSTQRTAQQIAFDDETKKDRLSKIKTEAEKASFELSTAKSQEEVASAKRKYELRKQAVLSTVPDAAMRQAIIDDLNKQGIENKLRTAQAGAAGASAGAASAQAAQTRLETADLQRMTPEERAQYRTKTGKYATTRSGGSAVAQGEFFNRLFEERNPKPTDPAKVPEWLAKRSAHVEGILTKLRGMDTDKQKLEAYKYWQMSDKEETFEEFARKTLGLSFTGASPTGTRPITKGWEIKRID